MLQHATNFQDEIQRNFGKRRADLARKSPFIKPLDSQKTPEQKDSTKVLIRQMSMGINLTKVKLNDQPAKSPKGIELIDTEGEFRAKSISKLKLKQTRDIERSVRNFIKHMSIDRVKDQSKIQGMVHNQLQHFLDSAFVQDNLFALEYIRKISRDIENEDVKNSIQFEDIFYSQIFKTALDSAADINNRQKIFEIINNLMMSKDHRQKLKSNNCLKQIFKMSNDIALNLKGLETAQYEPSPLTFKVSEERSPDSPESPDYRSPNQSPQTSDDEQQSQQAELQLKKQLSRSTPRKQTKESPQSKNDKRILQYTCQLAYKMAQNVKQEMEEIIEVKMIQFLVTTSHSSFPDGIRISTLKALSVLSCVPEMFDEFLDAKAIEAIFLVCQDENEIPETKKYALTVLVNFMLNSPGIVKLMIDLGIMNLFEYYRMHNLPIQMLPEDEQFNYEIAIKSNTAYLFFQLCMQKVQSQVLLSKGVTRDMFLIACDLKYKQVRHQVVAGFALLGRSDQGIYTEKLDQSPQAKEYRKIRADGIFRFHQIVEDDITKNISLLLHLSASQQIEHQILALRALQDLIIIHGRKMGPMISKISQAYTIGCLSTNETIKLISIAAISYLVRNKLVYRSTFREYLLQLEEEQRSHDFRSQESGKNIKRDVSFAKNIEREYSFSKKSQARNTQIDFSECIGDQELYIIDAIMLCTSSENEEIRSVSFQALSSLSEFSSDDRTILAQIKRDADMDNTSQDYLQFVLNRIEDEKAAFFQQCRIQQIEKIYPGFISIVQIAYGTSIQDVQKAANTFSDYTKMIQSHSDNKALALETEQSKDEEDQSEMLSFIGNQDYEYYYVKASQEQRVQNEQFFCSIYKVLLSTSIPNIVYQLLAIIKFYAEYHNKILNDQKKMKLESFEKVINSETITWLLTLIKKQLDNKHLSCLCSLTLLVILEKFEIEIEQYHTQEVTKNFNKILQGIQLCQPKGPNDSETSSLIESDISDSDDPADTLTEPSLLDDDSSEGKFNVQDFELNSTGSYINKQPLETCLTLPEEVCEEQSNESRTSSSQSKKDAKPGSGSSSQSKGSSQKSNRGQIGSPERVISTQPDEKMQRKLKSSNWSPEVATIFMKGKYQPSKDKNNAKAQNLNKQLIAGHLNAIKEESSSVLVTYKKPQISYGELVSPTTAQLKPNSLIGKIQVSPQKKWSSTEKDILSPMNKTMKSKKVDQRLQRMSTMRKRAASNQSLKKLTKMSTVLFKSKERLINKSINDEDSPDSPSLKQKYKGSSPSISPDYANTPNSKIQESPPPKYEMDSPHIPHDESAEEPLDKTAARRAQWRANKSATSHLIMFDSQRSISQSILSNDSQRKMDSNPSILKKKDSFLSDIKSISSHSVSNSSSDSPVVQRERAAYSRNILSPLSGDFKIQVNTAPDELVRDTNNNTQNTQRDTQTRYREMINKTQNTQNTQNEITENSSDEEEEAKEASQFFDQILAQRTPEQSDKSVSLDSENNNEHNNNYNREKHEITLRDSFIKTFMLIFTNKNNYSLLLNNDLIELALVIMEHGDQIKLEARVKSAKLASRLLKFEKTQKRFVNRNDGASIKGMGQIIVKTCQKDLKFKQIEEEIQLMLKKPHISRNDTVDLMKKNQQFFQNMITIQMILEAFAHISSICRRKVYADLANHIHKAVVEILKSETILKRLNYSDFLKICQVICDTHLGSQKSCMQFVQSSAFEKVLKVLSEGVGHLQLNFFKDSTEKLQKIEDKQYFQTEEPVYLEDLQIQNYTLQIITNLIGKQSHQQSRNNENKYIGIIAKSFIFTSKWHIDYMGKLQDQYSVAVSPQEMTMTGYHSIKELDRESDSTFTGHVSIQQDLTKNQTTLYDPNFQIHLQAIDKSRTQANTSLSSVKLQNSANQQHIISLPPKPSTRDSQERKQAQGSTFQLRIDSIQNTQKNSPIASTPQSQALGLSPQLTQQFDNNRQPPQINVTSAEHRSHESGDESHQHGECIQCDDDSNIKQQDLRYSYLQRNFKVQTEVIQMRINTFKLINSIAEILKASQYEDDQFKDFAKIIITELDLITTLNKDVEYLAKILAKVSEQPMLFLNDMHFEEYQEMHQMISNQYHELLDVIIQCYRLFQTSFMFIQKLTSPSILSNNQVNTLLDQLIVILSKLIEINNERVIDFFHVVGLIVYDQMHLDDQAKNHKQSILIASVLAKMFKITLNIDLNQMKIQLQIAVLDIMDSVILYAIQIMSDKTDLKWFVNTVVDDTNFSELLNNNLNSEDKELQEKTIIVLGHVSEFRDLGNFDSQPDLKVIAEHDEEMQDHSRIEIEDEIKGQMQENVSRNLQDIYQ